MTLSSPRIALDSNVLSALLRREPNAAQVATLLNQLRAAQTLTICVVVYAELLAAPGSTVPLIQQFLA